MMQIYAFIFECQEGKMIYGRWDR